MGWGGVMDIQELEHFESVYKPSKEVAFCWLRKQYVQLSAEEDHTEIVDHANDSLRIWQAAKAQAVPEWFDYTKQSPQMDGNYQIFIKGEQITAKWVSRFGFADPIEGDALRQELITHWAMQPQSPKAQEPAND